jgi:hypothetical protein
MEKSPKFRRKIVRDIHRETAFCFWYIQKELDGAIISNQFANCFCLKKIDGIVFQAKRILGLKDDF